jgi:hypothetical protein
MRKGPPQTRTAGSTAPVPVIGPRAQQSNGWPRARYGGPPPSQRRGCCSGWYSNLLHAHALLLHRTRLAARWAPAAGGLALSCRGVPPGVRRVMCTINLPVRPARTRNRSGPSIRPLGWPCSVGRSVPVVAWGAVAANATVAVLLAHRARARPRLTHSFPFYGPARLSRNGSAATATRHRRPDPAPPHTHHAQSRVGALAVIDRQA